MGYNATVVVLLDRLAEIERDPEFGKKLCDAIRAHGVGGKRIREVYVPGQTEVVEVQHADTLQIVAVGGNTGQVLGYGHYTQKPDDIIKMLERDRRARAKKVKPHG